MTQPAYTRLDVDARSKQAYFVATLEQQAGELARVVDPTRPPAEQLEGRA